jgi:rhodanese-related sulfurtransferase
VSSRAIARSSRYARAGSRSAQATVILREAGFTEVVNLAGGMLRWRVEDHGAEGGSA